MRNGKVKQIRKHKSIGYFLPAILLAVLVMGGFSCNLIGPHNASGPDTTSSNFTWTVDTIGASGSYLYDVSIVNDSLAYAVGLIMPSDSIGRSNTIYWDNAAVWNGTKWKPFQVPYYYNGKKTFTTLHCVFARNANDVWFESENWNGNTYTQSAIPFFAAYANKEWESPDGKQVYIVGTNGIIAYSPDHGSTWEQVQTGTTLPFQDIWGDGGQVLAVASSHNVAARQLYSLKGNNATAISDSGLSYVFGGVWFLADQKYYLAGDGVFAKSSLGQASWYRYPLGEVASYYSNAIRGTALNDIVIAGDFADISHFNGARWMEYKDLYNPIDKLRSIAIKGNTVIAVGIRTYSGLRYYALAYVGRR